MNELEGFDEIAKAIESIFPEDAPRFWDGFPLLHLYRKQRGYATISCPKCQGSLTNYYVGLVYASGRSLRQHMSPCAFICDLCNVVVLDEQMPREMAHMKGYQYTVPVGIYSLRRPVPAKDKLDFFKTYEGKAVVYMLDEDGFLEDIKYKDGDGLVFKTSSLSRSPDALRRKAKRKAERAARKKNRRH